MCLGFSNLLGTLSYGKICIYLLRTHCKKRSEKYLFDDDNVIFSDFLYKGICCGYSFELHRQVSAIQMSGPTSVAQLNACSTGDQEVAGSIPAEVGNILSWRLIMKYFLRSLSSFC